VIVADTSAIVALVDADDRHHKAMRRLYESDPKGWIVPWATLAEIDYLLGSHVGEKAQEAFLGDIAEGAFVVEWGRPDDLKKAHALHRKYRGIRLGLVDGVVISIAERLRAKAIATLDVRHFGAVRIRGGPRLLPRDG
jgi:uncharacterized protein